MRDILRASRWNILAVAGLMTALNSLKPLHVDDPFLYAVAKQIAAEPSDPYGIEVFWFQWPQPAIEELAPPVVPYCWGAAIAVFGENPLLWKLSLFPFAWLLAASAFHLACRFAPDLAGALTWMLAISPAFLAGFNFMLDVPAFALGLAGMAVFVKAVHSPSPRHAILAGLLMGLAMQTKYTGFVFPVVAFAFAALFRGIRFWAIAAVVSALVFSSWELFCFQKYGTSMLWGQVTQSGIASEYVARPSMIAPMIMHTGGLLPVLIPLGLIVLAMPRVLWIFAVAGILAGFALLGNLACEDNLFLTLGILVWLVIGLMSLKFLRSDGENSSGWMREDGFLILWVLLEIAGYFAIAPWPASRRVMGIAAAMVFLAFRFASRSVHRPFVLRDVRRITLFGVILGTVFFAVDLREAKTVETAARDSEKRIQATYPGTRIWFLGHWGFQFYAEQASMRPVIPDESLLKQGDILLVPFELPLQEIAYWERDDFLPLSTIRAETPQLDWLPSFSPVPSFYGGKTPLQFAADPVLTVDVFRVVRDHVPQTAWPTRKIADWTRAVGTGSRRKAIPVLIRRLSEGSVEDRRISARVLGEYDPLPPEAISALKRSLDDEDAEVRQAAADALSRITNTKKSKPSSPTPSEINDANN